MAVQGRRVWTDPEELQELIEKYFEGLEIWKEEIVEFTDENGEQKKITRPYLAHVNPPTMAGLAVALDVDRNTLVNYRGRPDFSIVLSRAKTRIAEFAEIKLYERESSNGAKFALEVNHGYGKEDGDGIQPEAFEMKTIAPAPAEDAVAIPKWSPETGEE